MEEVAPVVTAANPVDWESSVEEEVKLGILETAADHHLVPITQFKAYQEVQAAVIREVITLCNNACLSILTTCHILKMLSQYRYTLLLYGICAVSDAQLFFTTFETKNFYRLNGSSNLFT